VGARKKSGGGAGFKRILIAAGVLAALVFAVQGGEYGTRDLLRQRERKTRLVRSIDSVGRIVDSLKRYKRRLETDPVLQERLAREEFGMVRGTKELLYRIAEPAAGDSVAGRK
jgi:cell division protein FtsB